MDDLISIVVPVYNVADYLEKCLKSLLNQTYKNIQIILIDDGSTDDSGKICDQFRKKDGRIEVYHISNNGVSNARNYGLNHTHGKYIYFVDPDDYLEKEALEIMWNCIKKDSVDLVECSYFKNNWDGKRQEIIHLNSEIASQKGIESLLMWNGYVTSFCWDKLYIKEKIGDIRFNTSLKVGEDDLFVFEYLLRCEKISVLDIPLYNYLIRDNSAIGKVYTRKKKDSVKAAKTVQGICDANGIMSDRAKLHVGLAAFYSYANLLNTVPYKNIKEYDGDCQFYTNYMNMCSYNLIRGYVGLKIAILYKIAQYYPIIYKISGYVRKKRR